MKNNGIQRNPFPTVDIIIETPGGIVLIERRNEPLGWALPGGFVDAGESLESAAIREAKEETGLDVTLLCQLHAYSDPKRDPRFHTLSIVFVAQADGEPSAASDAKEARAFKTDALPQNLAFDHNKIISDYLSWKKDGFAVFMNAGE
jgi:8-oxo-dGTP diphosphatase